MKEQLTVKQALEQGYTLCGQDKGEWISLNNIEDMGHIDDFYDNTVIAEKEGISASVDADTLREYIADYAEDSWADETGDDRAMVYDAILEMDFSEIADKINKQIEHIKSYRLTDIKLVP